ncbi:glycosyltransferase family 4 protein [Jannaschia formosa]|uniref:glycosyltransferase family 4 protein n=1 Tax=Jannaschia formosa TaxID=2259592 RepID=UPI000E1BEB5C|nr:glycosyltransferase family 4 protein [Jannaschia formosa]TFL16371.1 glycosyltransferase [Jannaschia formosa]
MARDLRVDRTPRIIFVASEVLGWKTYARRMRAALAARSDVVHEVFSWQPPRLATLPVKRHGGGSFSRLMRPLDPILAYQSYLGREIRNALRRMRPDIVHVAAHWPAAAFASKPGAPPYTLALDCTRHGINALSPKPVWSAADLAREARLFRGAAHLFPMSEWAGASLTAECGASPDAVTICPPSVDLTAFAPPRQREGIPNILFVGNDFERKGGRRLVKWVEGPLAGRCHLHIVSHDPAARITGRYVTAHGPMAQDRLFLELMPRMDLFCLPTALDMSPQVLAEAAAAGLPAVASDLGGIGELVRHGVTGLLVTPGDEAGFVRALDRLIGDADERALMSVAARSHAENALNADRTYGTVVDRLVALTGHGSAAVGGMGAGG